MLKPNELPSYPPDLLQAYLQADNDADMARIAIKLKETIEGQRSAVRLESGDTWLVEYLGDGNVPRLSALRFYDGRKAALLM